MGFIFWKSSSRVGAWKMCWRERGSKHCCSPFGLRESRSSQLTCRHLQLSNLMHIEPWYIHPHHLLISGTEITQLCWTSNTVACWMSSSGWCTGFYEVEAYFYKPRCIQQTFVLLLPAREYNTYCRKRSQDKMLFLGSCYSYAVFIQMSVCYMHLVKRL